MKNIPRLMLVLFVAVLILFMSTSCFLEKFFDPDPVLEAPKFEGFYVEGRSYGWHIDIWWSTVDGADAYEVYRACPDLNLIFENVNDWNTDDRWSDYGELLPGDELKLGVTYQYKVRGHFDDGGYGPFSEILSVPLPAFLPPENLSVTLLTDGNSVMVDWDPVEDAENYEVHRSEESSYGYSKIAETTETLFSDDSIAPSTTYFYKVFASNSEYGDTDFCEAVWIDTGEPPITASWIDLGSPGFASAEGDVELASVGGNLYALFADADDTDNRIKVMSHDGSDGGSWTDTGGYLSLSTVVWDRVYALADGDTLYAAYADTDDTVTAGGSPRIFVKQYLGSAWSAVGAGSDDGVSTYDILLDTEIGVFGAMPALAAAGTDLFMVYQTSSFALVDSLSYPGSGDYWSEEDSDYWNTGMISAGEIGLDVDSAGRPVAALESGSLNLYRYETGSWGSFGSEFDDGGGSDQMYILGFLLDSTDVPYFAFETLSAEGSKIDVSRWTGTAWENLNQTAELIAPKTLMDLDIVENPDGSGIYSAVVYQDTDNLYKIELWKFDDAGWLQIGPTIDWATGITAVDAVFDSLSRPVLVFTEGSTSDAHAKALRE